MKNRLQRRTAVVVVAALVASITTATTYTFEGTGTNINIPTAWGSNAAANGTGWNVANGATPNIGLGWSTTTGSTWQYYNDSEWTGVAQLDGFSVADKKFDLSFTPDSEFMVQLSSFVFDDYADYAAGNVFKWTVFGGTVNGATLATGTETTTNGQNLTVTTGLGFVSGPIVLRIENMVSGADGFDQAIDNVVINQQAVPEPATIAALSLGVVALVRNRRKG